jgi:hypothetical protein
MSTKAILVFLMVLVFPPASSSQTSSLSSASDKLVVTSDQFSAIQQLLNDQANRGYRVLSVSYHSSFKDLHRKGRLEIGLKASEVQEKREYRVLTPELEASELARELSANAALGFRLVKPTPIPLELGLLRPRDMFIAIMERPAGSRTEYSYRVVAYRHLPLARDKIKQALAEGFTEVCSHQFGPVIYLIFEKVAN